MCAVYCLQLYFCKSFWGKNKLPSSLYSIQSKSQKILTVAKLHSWLTSIHRTVPPTSKTVLGTQKELNKYLLNDYLAGPQLMVSKQL